MADETRVQMWCDVCRQGDDHPRHHILQADGTVQTRHMDCCRDTGCTDATCSQILTNSGEKRGYELLSWIKENG
jgi:hypothetical protein